MHAVLSLTDCLKHIIEFLLSAHQERDGVVVGKLTPFPRSWLTINESLVCALHSELASHKVAINK